MFICTGYVALVRIKAIHRIIVALALPSKIPVDGLLAERKMFSTLSFIKVVHYSGQIVIRVVVEIEPTFIVRVRIRQG